MNDNDSSAMELTLINNKIPLFLNFCQNESQAVPRALPIESKQHHLHM